MYDKLTILLILYLYPLSLLANNGFNAIPSHHASVGTVPLFIENKKQWPGQVQYKFDGNGTTAWFLKNKVRFDAYTTDPRKVNPEDPTEIDTTQKRKGQVYDMEFVGASLNTSIDAQDKSVTYYNYFIGNDSTKWSSYVGLYHHLYYRQLYPGIDVHFFNNEEEVLQYDFIVEPGGDYKKIQLKFTGQENLSLDGEGNLSIGTAYLGKLIVSKPLTYQVIEGEKKILRSKYWMHDGQIGFQILDKIDPNLPIVIDPQLKYSTFLYCSTCSNYSHDIDANNAGEAIATGFASNSNFPTTLGAYQTLVVASNDVFISKLNTIGSVLIFSTFLGDSGVEYGSSIKFDLNNHVVVTGYTNSTGFPLTINAIQPTLGGVADVFITKFNPSGSSLVFSSFLGGSFQDAANEVYIDPNNNIYIAGRTSSNNFPTTIGVVKRNLFPASNGTFYEDGFLTMIDVAGYFIGFSTFIGGSDSYDQITGIDIKNNSIYICGTTNADSFPTTINAYQTKRSAMIDGFVAVLSNNASSIKYATYIGGSDNDFVHELKFFDGKVFIAGFTKSANFPVTPGAFSTTINPNAQFIYISSLDSTLTTLNRSTFIGDGYAFGMDMNNCGSVIISGFTSSVTYPITNDAFKKNVQQLDNVITAIDSSLSNLLFSTFFGGSSADYGQASIAIRNNIFYVSGTTHSPDFPTTPGAFQTVKVNSFDTPYMLAIKDMCFLPDATNVSVYPTIFCTASPPVVHMKANPQTNTCTAGTGIVRWYKNWNKILLAQSEDTTLQLNFNDTLILVVEDTLNKCKSKDVPFVIKFGLPLKKPDTINLCTGDSIFLQGAFRKLAGIYIDTIKGGSCDSLFYRTLSFNTITTHYYKDICEKDSFVFNGHVYKTTGTYYDTLKSYKFCDSVLITHLRKIQTLKRDTLTFCAGHNYLVGSHIYNSNGTYTDSLLNYLGCDSIIVSTLSFLSNLSDSVVVFLCAGSNIKVGKNTYSVSGNYIDTLKSFHGCDSFNYLQLHVGTINATPIIQYVCEGDSLLVNGKKIKINLTHHNTLYYDTTYTNQMCHIKKNQIDVLPTKTFANNFVTMCEDDEGYTIGNSTYYKSGFYKDTIQQVNGCDSIVETTLTVLPKITTSASTFVTICQGRKYVINNHTYTTAGTYIDTFKNKGGCDSFYQYTVIAVTPSSNTLLDTQICSGASVKVGNTFYNKTVDRYDTLVAFNTCDSIVHLKLTVNQPDTTFLSVSICFGDYYAFNNLNITTPGAYYDTLQNIKQCDSLIRLQLKVNPTPISTRTFNLCSNDSIFLQHQWQHTSGLYRDTLKTFLACDSIIESQVNFFPYYFNTFSPVLCKGDTFKVGAKNYIVSGFYRDTFKIANACDSIIHTNLTVNNSYNYNRTWYRCQGQFVFLQGSPRTVSGNYTDSFITYLGCDSIIHTQLIIIDTSAFHFNINICDGAKYFAAKAFQTATGVYLDTFINMAGCDSIVYTHLFVYPNLKTTISKNLCKGDQFFAAGKYQTSSGTYIDHYKTIHQCDSEVTHLLTFHPTYAFKTDLTICGGSSATFHYKTFNQSGSYIARYYTTAGCDSFYQLDLTVLPYPTGTDSLAICPGDSFSSNHQIYKQAGIYRDTIQRVSACDSIHQTVISWLPKQGITQEIQLCREEVFLFHNKPIQHSGIYVDTFKNRYGCDSILMLKITIQDCDTACNILIPTAFSPNADGANDVFRPVVHLDKTVLLNMQVFDRWGGLMFDAKNSQTYHWNGHDMSGEPCMQGVYTWLIQYKCEGQLKTVKGNVTLLR